MRRIYMDYAATTPVDDNVMVQMAPYFSQIYGNPSSVHGAGAEAQGGVIAARRAAAGFLNCDPNEIAFTSGASEGNNAVIRSFTGAKTFKRIGQKPHIIISSIEHDCVLESAKTAEANGEAELTILPVNRDGLVNPDEAVSAIRPNTVLISVMYANNETGIIQPIPKIGRALKGVNLNRADKIFFHTDAVQAANYLDCDVQYLGVDLMTLSAHKIYGPKGVGLLYVKSGTFFDPLIKGGEQEFHKRAGTHNTPGIVGMGAAISEVVRRRHEIPGLIRLRDRLINGILGSIPDTHLAGRADARIPNNVNIIFPGCSGRDILTELSAAGVFVSTGSACAAKSVDPSHVLTAMGFTAAEAMSAIRFTIGRHTTAEEIDYVLEVLPRIIKSLAPKRSGSGEENLSTKPGDQFGWYPEVTVTKAGYQTVMDSRLPFNPGKYEGTGVSSPKYPNVDRRDFRAVDADKKIIEGNSRAAVHDRISPAGNASFGKINSDIAVYDLSKVKFYGDEEVNREGLPADLGCERNRKVGEEE